MIISIIVAMSENNGIGISGELPWHLPDDLKRFKALTMGHHLIVGRKTFESIGKPLPGRKMIVLSRNPLYHPDGVEKAHSLEDALQIAQKRDEDEVFIGGGERVYESALAMAHRLHLTKVHATTEADAFFPDIAETDWDVIESDFHPVDDQHAYAFTYMRMDKRQSTEM
jgi:dihydrofolate reductase